MITRYAADEADIRQRLDRFLDAVRAMDIEGIRPIYAPDLVSFDIVPPLRHLGAEAKLNNWRNVFAAYRAPLGYELQELVLTVGDGMAFGRSFNRINGTLRNGKSSDYWVRWTTCYRKIDRDWLIVHDQVSVPMDVETGRALRDLKP